MITETNAVMLRELNKVYTPKTFGVLNETEITLITNKLHLDERDILNLRNLRDYVVVIYGRMCDREKELSMTYMDKMSAITHLIDVKIWELGGEV